MVYDLEVYRRAYIKPGCCAENVMVVFGRTGSKIGALTLQRLNSLKISAKGTQKYSKRT